MVPLPRALDGGVARARKRQGGGGEKRRGQVQRPAAPDGNSNGEMVDGRKVESRGAGPSIAPRAASYIAALQCKMSRLVSVALFCALMLVPGGQAVNTAANCETCRWAMDSLRAKAQDIEPLMVQAVKAAVCSHTPTAECREMAETLVPEVTAWLTSPSAADQLCSGRNVCGNSNALALSQAQLRSKKRQAVQNGALCGMCEHVLTRAVGDREPMALAQFQEYAMAACTELPFSMAETCSNMVESYHLLLAPFASHMDAWPACAAAGLCTAELLQQSPVRPLPDSVVSRLVQLRQYAQLQDSTECELCRATVTEVSAVISNPQIQQQILNYTKELCDSLAGTSASTCRTYVDLYGPAIFILINQYLKPDPFCIAIGMCPNATHTAHAPLTHLPGTTHTARSGQPATVAMRAAQPGHAGTQQQGSVLDTLVSTLRGVFGAKLDGIMKPRWEVYGDQGSNQRESVSDEIAMDFAEVQNQAETDTKPAPEGYPHDMPGDLTDELVWGDVIKAVTTETTENKKQDQATVTQPRGTTDGGAQADKGYRIHESNNPIERYNDVYYTNPEDEEEYAHDIQLSIRNQAARQQQQQQQATPQGAAKTASVSSGLPAATKSVLVLPTKADMAAREAVESKGAQHAQQDGSETTQHAQHDAASDDAGLSDGGAFVDVQFESREVFVEREQDDAVVVVVDAAQELEQQQDAEQANAASGDARRLASRRMLA